MSIRMLALACLAGASIAVAAPPKKDPTDTAQSAESLDVDAMARAKDETGATPKPEDAPPAAPVESAPTEAPPPEAAPTEAPPALAPQADAPAPAVEDAPAPAVETAAPAAASSAPKSLEAPPGVSRDEEQKVSIAAACSSRASSLLDDAQKADYGNATRDFNATMRSQMPPAKLKEQWESLAQFGKLVARGQSHLGTGDGYTIVMIPLIFEKTNLVAQIACGTDGRIAGFHVNQAPKPKY